MSDQKTMQQYEQLSQAVEQVVEFAEPIYSGNDGEHDEYVIPAEEYNAMFDALISIKEGRANV